MRISNEGVALIKRFEGLELEAYRDAVGILTIGYGHTGDDVYEGQVINESEAESILRRDLDRFEVAVNEGIKGPTAQSMFDAFVSLSFNVGASAFKKSTALKRHNKRDYTGAAEAITWWNKAGGQVLAGLVRRRAAEEALYLEGLTEVTDDTEMARAEIEENTPRRSNPVSSRTTAGAGTAGAAGATGAGAVLLDEDEENADGTDTSSETGATPDDTADQGDADTVDDSPDDAADTSDTPPEDTPADEETSDTGTDEGEDTTTTDEGEDGTETVETTEDDGGSMRDKFTPDDQTEAIVIIAGIIAVIAAAYVIFARIDDWFKYRR